MRGGQHRAMCVTNKEGTPRPRLTSVEEHCAKQELLERQRRLCQSWDCRALGPEGMTMHSWVHHCSPRKIYCPRASVHLRQERPNHSELRTLAKLTCSGPGRQWHDDLHNTIKEETGTFELSCPRRAEHTQSHQDPSFLPG